MSLINLTNSLDDIIFSFSTTRSIYAYSVTCKEAHTRATDYLFRAFRYSKFLSEFFTRREQRLLLEFQRATGSLISGEALLCFLLRKPLTTDTLHLFVHIQYGDLLKDWVLTTSYHTLVDKPDIGQQTASLFDWDKPSESEEWQSLDNDLGDGSGVFITLTNEEKTKKVVVHFSTISPLQVVVSQAATCYMNFATHARVHCLYPIATLEHDETLLRLGWHHLIGRPELEKITQLGLHVRTICPSQSFGIFPYGHRNAKDHFTWTFVFWNATAESDNRLYANSWMAFYTPDRHLVVSGVTLRSPRLIDAYMFSDEKIRRRIARLLTRLQSRPRQTHNFLFDEDIYHEIASNIYLEEQPLRLAITNY